MAMQSNDLRAIREWCGLGQARLAKELGVSATWLNQVENGHKQVDDRIMTTLMTRMHLQRLMDETVARRADTLAMIASMEEAGAIINDEGDNVLPGIIRNMHAQIARFDATIADGRENYGLIERLNPPPCPLP